MLLFGVGMYVMFMGSKAVKDKGPRFTESNLFGLFYMKVPLSHFLTYVDRHTKLCLHINSISFNHFRQLQHGLI